MVATSTWALISIAALASIQPVRGVLADEAGCLVVGAWDEARGEPAPVIEAVISTLINRARSRGLSVCDAVMDPAALTGVTPAMHELFSEAAKPRGEGELTPQPHTRNDRAQLAVVEAAAEAAVAGSLRDRTNGATHFYSPAGMRELGLDAAPGWAASMVQTATVGPFVFLREKGGGQSRSNVALAAVPSVEPVASPVEEVRRNAQVMHPDIDVVHPDVALLPPPPVPSFDPAAQAGPYRTADEAAAAVAANAQPAIPTPVHGRAKQVAAIEEDSPAEAKALAALALPAPPGEGHHAQTSTGIVSPPVALPQIAAALSPIDAMSPPQLAETALAPPPPAPPVHPMQIASLPATALRSLPVHGLAQPIQMATVVLDEPGFLDVPKADGPHFSIVAEASAAELPPQDPAANAQTQSDQSLDQGQAADTAQQQPSDDSSQQAEAAGQATDGGGSAQYERTQPAAPRMEKAPTQLFGATTQEPTADQPQADDAQMAEQAPEPPRYQQRYAAPAPNYEYAPSGQYATPPQEYSNQPPAPPPAQYAAPAQGYWTPPVMYGPPQAYAGGYWAQRPVRWNGCRNWGRKVVTVQGQWGGLRRVVVFGPVCGR